MAYDTRRYLVDTGRARSPERRARRAQRLVASAVALVFVASTATLAVRLRASGPLEAGGAITLVGVGAAYTGTVYHVGLPLFNESNGVLRILSIRFDRADPNVHLGTPEVGKACYGRYESMLTGAGTPAQLAARGVPVDWAPLHDRPVPPGKYPCYYIALHLTARRPGTFVLENGSIRYRYRGRTFTARFTFRIEMNVVGFGRDPWLDGK